MSMSYQKEQNDSLIHMQQFVLSSLDGKFKDDLSDLSSNSRNMTIDASMMSFENRMKKSFNFSTSSTKHQLLQSSLETDAMETFREYASVIDFTEPTGLNNFAEKALALCSFFKNDSLEWKACHSGKLIRKTLLGQTSNTEGQVVAACEDDILVIKDSSCSPNKTFSGAGNLKSAALKNKTVLSSPTPCQQTNAYIQETHLGCIVENQASRLEEQESGRLPGCAKEEFVQSHANDSPKLSVPFRTAKEQLFLNSIKKHDSVCLDARKDMLGGQGSVGRKSLGTRRGPTSKFISPVLNKDSNELVMTDGDTKARQNNLSEVCHQDVADDRLKGIDPKLIEHISNEIMDSGTHVIWSDIAGLEFAKKTIKEVVVWPMLRPDIFTGLRGPPKGLLLFGPPGTGKTLIGKCIASQSRSTFFCISASSLTSKWVGEGEKMVRALFAVARCHQPSVIFVDEIDSLLSQRSDNEHESSRRIKTEFLVQLDGVATKSEDRILIIGATNRPQEIDEAARRRFVKRLFIALPEAVARRQIIISLMSSQSFDLSEGDILAICDKTNGYSGADMANLCREAALGPIRSIPTEQIESIAPDQVRPIVYQDFEDALLQVRASVSTKDLKIYKDWNQAFGSFGNGES